VTTAALSTDHLSGAVPPLSSPRPALHVVKPSSGADLVAAELAAAAFLIALGVDLDTESLAATPARMARAYAEMFSPRPFDLTTFPNDAGYDELIIARAIPVQSVCEHHLLPFVGVAHVGYLPGARILGLSKLARVVELFARRPQVQERLTQQIADWLQDQIEPRGLGVVVEVEHLCMTVRGVRASGANTVTSALHGQLRSDAASRAEFFTLIGSHEQPTPLPHDKAHP
jgi:GTP cyclohydrolase IA